MAVDGRSGGLLVEFQPMSPEDMERTMQFLLNQQAQFAADFERLSGKTDRIADGLIGLTGIVGRAADQIVQLAAAQAAAQAETDRQLKELREEDRRLADYIQSVEAHLNIVVDMFERHLREDHGRRPS
jgi:hypothetical protein